MIKIICVGKIKEDYLKKANQDYLQRIKKYHPIEIIEVEAIAHERNLELEKSAIMKKINTNEQVFLLAIEGMEINSQQFSQKIEKSLASKANLTFIIGGSDGVHADLEKYQQISFSKLTFPHQLFRIILLEQIYRSFKIINNEKYHK